MVSAPNKYKWSSYNFFIGKKKTPEFIETDWLLSSFGKNKKAALKNYKDFVEGADITTLENPSRHVTEGFILGDVDFVTWVKDTFLTKKQDNKEIPQLKRLKPKIQVEAVLKAVSEEFGCDQQ